MSNDNATSAAMVGPEGLQQPNDIRVVGLSNMQINGNAELPLPKILSNLLTGSEPRP